MPTIWQPNKTDTGKRQNTAVRNTEPPRPELGGAVFFIPRGGVGFVGEKIDYHRADTV